jgi:hypothetical protein
MTLEKVSKSHFDDKPRVDKVTPIWSSHIKSEGLGNFWLAFFFQQKRTKVTSTKISTNLQDKISNSVSNRDWTYTRKQRLENFIKKKKQKEVT